MTLVPVSSVYCAPQMLDSPAVSDDAKGQLGGAFSLISISLSKPTSNLKRALLLDKESGYFITEI